MLEHKMTLEAADKVIICSASLIYLMLISSIQFTQFLDIGCHMVFTRQESEVSNSASIVTMCVQFGYFTRSYH